MSEITQLLQSAGPDGLCDSEKLLPLVYDELRRHAAMRMAHEAPGQTLQPTALVHEAWLRLTQPRPQPQQWQNRAHFFGAAAEAMRRILIEQARRKMRLRRGGDLQRVDLDGIDPAAASPDERILMINEALEELEAGDPVKAKIVVLKFFAGFSNQEVADCLDVTERTVERHWAFAKAWLFQRIRALK